MSDRSPAGGTPLTPQERDGLIPTHITRRDELNELEQQNILAADQWAFARRRNVASEPFLRGLHRRMFNQVWRWAGRYRRTERNLGVASYRIQTDLHQLLDDVGYWIEHQTHPREEIAVRFHHRLVSIHPFPNGNGRWSRLAADLLIVNFGGGRFSWGGATLQSAGVVRRNYIEALRAADAQAIEQLMKFARS